MIYNLLKLEVVGIIEQKSDFSIHFKQKKRSILKT